MGPPCTGLMGSTVHGYWVLLVLGYWVHLYWGTGFICTGLMGSTHQSCEDATSIFIYDSLKYLTIEHKLKCDVASIVHSQLDNLKFNVMNVDGQLNLSDCGVYAVAYATHLAFGLDPTHCLWDHKQMRGHLLSCLEDGEMTCFPSKGDRSIRTRRRILKYVIERIYCSCRMPNDRTKSMIQCSRCLKWFHHVCMALEEQSSMYGVEWNCHNC